GPGHLGVMGDDRDPVRAEPHRRGDVHRVGPAGTASSAIASSIRSSPILECRGRIETERLLDAAKQARAEGLLTTAEWQGVRKALRLSSTA
ncbi:MAG: hypothetical protein WAL91_10360, partial [Propionicimonas sp.]